MKKNTKSIKSPAPATKPVKKKAPPARAATAPKTSSAKAAKPVAKKAAPSKPAKAAPVAAPVKSPSVPAANPVTPAPALTTITATIDIGFGNALYLRGEGAGLSWDRGILMNCVANNCWSIELSEAARPVIYKFLVNDLTWSAGEDYTVAAGASVNVVPTFGP